MTDNSSGSDPRTGNDLRGGCPASRILAGTIAIALLYGAAGGARSEGIGFPVLPCDAELAKIARARVRGEIPGPAPATHLAALQGASAENAAAIARVRRQLAQLGVAGSTSVGPPAAALFAKIPYARADLSSGELAKVERDWQAASAAIRLEAIDASKLVREWIPVVAASASGRISVPEATRIPSLATWQESVKLPADGIPLIDLPRVVPKPGNQSPQMTLDPSGPGRDLAENDKRFPGRVDPKAPPVAGLATKSDAACASSRDAFLAAYRGQAQKLAVHARSAEEFVAWWHHDDGPKRALAEELHADPAVKAVWAAAKNYSDNCFTGRLPSGVAAAQVPRLVGALGFDSNRSCTGTRVARDRVLTAKHCLMTVDELGPLALLGPDAIQRHWFEFRSDEPFRYQVCGIEAKAADGPYLYATDFVVLRIADPGDAPPKVTLASAPPRWGAQFYVPGLDLAEEQNYAPFEPKATAVSGCMITAGFGPCIVHGCQTLPGMSGAPMFALDPSGNVTLTLAGIHLTGFDPKGSPAPALGSTCTLDPKVRIDRTLNLGIATAAIVPFVKE